MDKKYDNLGYQTSIHGKQCLTSCYKPMTKIVDPKTLRTYLHTEDPICIISGRKAKTPLEFVDQCKKPDKIQEKQNLVPIYYFEHDTFLDDIYDIHSFDDAFEYFIINEDLPALTKRRIIDSCLKCFDYEVDDRLVTFYYDNMPHAPRKQEIYNVLIKCQKNKDMSVEDEIMKKIAKKY